MNNINQPITPHVKKVIEGIDEQIAMHKTLIEHLQKTRELWLRNQSEGTKFFPLGQPLTREYIRNFLKGYRKPVQTLQIIDILYKDKEGEERYKLVKHLAVMLNQMAEKGELVVSKLDGVKGNFFQYKGIINSNQQFEQAG